MSEPERDDDGPVPDGWSHLTEEQREALKLRFAEARARHAEGKSIPMDEVLPRYRQAG